MKLILIFMSITEKKIQVDENGREYILFRIDVYFTKCFLAVEIDEKGHSDRHLIFEEKGQKALEEKLNCEFIKRTRRRNKKIRTLINKSKCISCQKTFYLIIKNEKHTGKNKTNKTRKKTSNNILFRM